MTDYFGIIDDSELERIPDRIRRFLFCEQAPSNATQSLAFYAYGYTRAFEQLVDVALQRWPSGDYMRMPLFFLARHSLELHLKEAIRLFSMVDEVKFSDHRLAKLWTQLLVAIKSNGYETGDEYADYCGKLINHIHEADPSGERFRYPISTSGIEFEYTRVELEGLVRAHFHITNYCEGSILMLKERWS
jgi:hypothetical protein